MKYTEEGFKSPKLMWEFFRKRVVKGILLAVIASIVIIGGIYLAFYYEWVAVSLFFGAIGFIVLHDEYYHWLSRKDSGFED